MRILFTLSLITICIISGCEEPEILFEDPPSMATETATEDTLVMKDLSQFIGRWGFHADAPGSQRFDSFKDVPAFIKWKEGDAINVEGVEIYSVYNDNRDVDMQFKIHLGEDEWYGYMDTLAINSWSIVPGMYDTVWVQIYCEAYADSGTVYFPTNDTINKFVMRVERTFSLILEGTFEENGYTLMRAKVDTWYKWVGIGKQDDENPYVGLFRHGGWMNIQKD